MTFDKVYGSHVLEHVRQQDVPHTLDGIRRILKPGGQFLVSVPDWDILCHLFINPQASAEVKWHALRMMLGGQIDDYDYHNTAHNTGVTTPGSQHRGHNTGVTTPGSQHRGQVTQHRGQVLT